MTWNGVCKVLDFEGPFEATGEKASERSHDGGKTRQGDAVDLEWVQLHCGPASDGLKYRWQAVVLKLEELRWLTVHCKSVGVVVELYRTHKVAVTCHHIGQLERGRNC